MKNRISYRRGSMLTELIVGAGLLVTFSGLVSTTVFANRRLQRLEQQQRVAVDELANQASELTTLDSKRLLVAIANLHPSDRAREVLPNATLEADLLDDEYGERIVLQLHWDREAATQPLTAVVWLASLEAADE